METIGKRINAFREKEGLTQADIFRATRIKQQTLSSIESGTEPKSGVIAALLDAYPKLNPEWLLQGKGSMLRGVNEQPADPVPAKVEAAPLQVVAEPETERERELARRVRWLEGQVDLWQRIATSGVDLTKLQATGTDGSFLMGEDSAAKNMWVSHGPAVEMAA